MKKFSCGLIAVIFLAAVVASSAEAGSKQRHRWEGAAIGIGAAIIGGAIINSMNQNYRAAEPVYSRPERTCNVPPKIYHEPRPLYHDYRPYPSPPPRQYGHWEIRQTWVPPVYEKVWNPPHYNKRHEWVPGEWIQIEKAPGYWREERVWIADR